MTDRHSNALRPAWWIKRVVFPLVPALLAMPGCRMVVQDEASPFSLVPVGARLVLHRDVEVPPGWAQVEVQRGRVVPPRAYNRYYPHCRFEVRDISPEPQVIRAGEFRVASVSRETDYFADAATGGPVRSVSIRGGLFGDGASMQMQVVKMRLDSSDQPEVQRLVCGGALDDPVEAVPPSVQEIRGALGGVASLEFP